jgi:hypothetical protein
MSANNVQPGSKFHSEIAFLRDAAEEAGRKADECALSDPERSLLLRRQSRRLDLSADQSLFAALYRDV